MGNMLANPNKEDLAFVGELFNAGKVRAVIEKRFTLSQVPEALQYVNEGHAQGKLIITVKA